MLAPETLSPDDRSKKRQEFYNKLQAKFNQNLAYKLAEILVKPPEGLTESDKRHLSSLKVEIEAAIGEGIGSYL